MDSVAFTGDMSYAELVQEIRKASPSTWIEVSYFLIFIFIGIIILLRPGSIPGFANINPAEILQQPGWVGLVTLLGSPFCVLATPAYRWVKTL